MPNSECRECAQHGTVPRPPAVARLQHPHQRGSFDEVFTHRTVAAWGDGRASRGARGLTGEVV
jgi:hypothetical protein